MRHLKNIPRLLLGIAFLFAGFAKGVDPMGGAIQLGEYFGAYGLEWLRGSEYFWAIASATLEFALGALLICGFWPRVVALIAGVAMLFFTLLAFNIALTNPVADCGCFGEAIKLSNWQTFWKNAAILLPLSVLNLIIAWRKKPAKRTSRSAFAWLALFVLAGVGMGEWAMRHLPIVDFLPYKIGTDLLAAPAAPEAETTLIYKNLATGEQREFALTDTTWWDETAWEYVDTRIPEADLSETFAILDQGRDITRELLEGAGELYLLCVSDIAAMPEEVEIALERAQKADVATIALTPSPLAEGETFHGTPYYNMDDTTLKSLLRADYGLVIVQDGVIVKKYRFSDIP